MASPPVGVEQDAAAGSARGHTTAATAVRFAQLARALHRSGDLTQVMQRIVDTAVAEVPGAAFAGLTVLGRRRATTPAFSDGLAQQVDELQYQTGEGPCLDAAAQVTAVRVDDLAAEARWPQFTVRALELGVRSVLSFQLSVDAGSIGSLNLYASKAHAFPAQAEDAGLPLAAHAAVAIAARRAEANLRVALESRDVIGQAKGILMERFRLSADEAFELLVAASQQAHVKLRTVAERLTLTGEITLADPPGGTLKAV